MDQSARVEWTARNTGAAIVIVLAVPAWVLLIAWLVSRAT